MALRSSVPGIRIARLERTARLAGEAFGHEELVRLDDLAPASPARRLWAAAALLSVLGLCLLALR